MFAEFFKSRAGVSGVVSFVAVVAGEPGLRESAEYEPVGHGAAEAEVGGGEVRGHLEEAFVQEIKFIKVFYLGGVDADAQEVVGQGGHHGLVLVDGGIAALVGVVPHEQDQQGQVAAEGDGTHSDQPFIRQHFIKKEKFCS